VTGPDRPRSHEAGGSLLGYLYQVDLALLELLRRSPGNPAVGVRIEQLDDVLFEERGSPIELLQTKHHVRSPGTLTDTSRDVWRTVGVWSDLLEQGQIDISNVILSLLTTGIAPDESAASRLRPGSERDWKSALSRLEQVARTGAESSNADDYRRFLTLDAKERARLLSVVEVLDASQPISGIENAIKAELRRAATPNQLEPLADRLMSWWHGRVIRQLLRVDPGPIFGEEVDARIDDLRLEFSADNLPIDVFDDDSDLEHLSVDERIFVRQLQLIAANDKLIELAIADYKRAYVQRQRWTDESLLLPGELDRYERRLVDEWRHHEAALEQRTGTADSEEAVQAAGMGLYLTLQDKEFWIRPLVQQPFVVRGSYHRLADQLKVGWHADFVARLQGLLEDAS
jgi:ABC-3C protein